MAVTKKDLERHVSGLNKKYAKSGKNEFVINGAYGGYMVGIRGKKTKKGFKKWTSSGIRTVGNPYHDTPRKTIEGLERAEANGSLQRAIRSENAKTRKRAKLKTWHV